MKKLLNIFLAAGLVLAFAACDFGLDGASAGSASQFQNAAEREHTATSAGAQFRVNAFRVEGTGLLESIDPAEEDDAQIIELDFENGVVDSDSVAANISVRTVVDADETWQAYTAGTSISFTHEVVPSLDGESSTLYLTLDQSNLAGIDNNATTGDPVQIEVIVGEGLTANNGRRQMNQDGDQIAGESEDAYINYARVADDTGGRMPQPAGIARNPRREFIISGPYQNNDVEDAPQFGGTETFDGETIPDSVYFVTRTFGIGLDATELQAFDNTVVMDNDVFNLQRLEGQRWENVALTITRVQPSVYEVTPAGGFQNGSLYRWRAQRDWASTEWQGYTMRYDSFNNEQLGEFMPRGGNFNIDRQFEDPDDLGTFTGSINTTEPQITDAGISGGKGMIEVDFQQSMVANTITANIFRVEISGNRIPIASVDAVPGSDNQRFRITLGGIAPGVDFQLYVYPGAIVSVDANEYYENQYLLNGTDPFFEMPASYLVTFSVGDEGPAGGTIFYIDTANMYSWTYLEAAPVNAIAEYPWGTAGVTIGTNNTAIGTGKTNTQDIIDELEEDGQAAWYAATLDEGGYTDWFLPSRDELIEAVGTVDVSQNYHWSSSEDGQSWSYAVNHSGTDTTVYKTNWRYVLPIRSF